MKKMDNLEKENEKRIISRDTFIQFFKTQNMSEEDAIELVNSIYNKIKERYEIRTEAGNTALLDEKANNQRNIAFTQFYYLARNVYDIEQIKNSQPEVQNDIIEKIMDLCQEAIDKQYNSWNYTKTIEFIKLLFDKYEDTNSDRLINCIEYYIKCERKDSINRIIDKTIREPENPCEIEQITNILKKYNLMIFRSTKYEINNKGNNKKIKIDKLIELAELCIDNKLPNEKIAELFEKGALIIRFNPEAYYDVIESNYEQAKKGKIEAKKVVDIIKNYADKLASKEIQKQKDSQSVRDNKFNKNNFKLEGMVKKFKKKKVKKAALQYGIPILAGLAGLFAGGMVKEAQIKKLLEQKEQQNEELIDDNSDEFESTYNESLPISIKCNVNGYLGPYGPEEGSEVIARVSVNGEMKSIVWQDSDGTVKQLTNNLENYMKYLDVINGERTTSIISDYTIEDEVFNKGDIVEIVYGPYTSDESKFVTVRKEGGYNIDIPYNITEEARHNLSGVQAYARSLKGKEVDDETKIMPQQFTLTMDYADQNSEMTYNAGESMGGYLTVEDGQPVVKKAKTVNGEDESVTIPFYGYFETSDREVESETGIMGIIASENNTFTTDQPIFVWGNDYDELVSIIQPGEEIGIDLSFKKDGQPYITGTVDNIKLGELEAYSIYDGLKNYFESMQPDSVIDYIEDNYPDKENVTYYNGIFVPKNISNDILEAYLKTLIEEDNKMPNTENSDNDMTYIEISPNVKNIKNIINRIRSINEETKTPYGIRLNYDSSKTQVSDVKEVVSQIQSSECGEYFRGGLIINPSGLPDKYIEVALTNENGPMTKWDGTPETEEKLNPDYTDEINNINSLVNELAELGIQIIILDSKDSSLEISDIESEKVSYALKAERGKDNKLSGAVTDYNRETYENESKKVSIWFDDKNGQVAVEDDIVRSALLQIAEKEQFTYTEEDINWDERY